MPPAWATNPAPRTEAAKEARRAFFCDLCQKGYSRSNEFEAHEGSYDHQHKKRLKEMKALSRDPNAASKARRAEEKAEAAITIKPISLGGGGAGTNGKTPSKPSGFRKGGFKSAFAPDADTARNDPPTATLERAQSEKGEVLAASAANPSNDVEMTVESQAVNANENVSSVGETGVAVAEEEQSWGDYDPRRPTGCGPGCRLYCADIAGQDGYAVA